jgi:hypothetical protein
MSKNYATEREFSKGKLQRKIVTNARTNSSKQGEYKKGIYLISRASFAKGFDLKFLWDNGFLHQCGDSLHRVVDLHVLQFIRGKPSGILAPRITPHAVHACSKGLDSMLDESSGQLKTGDLLSRSGPQLSNFFASAGQ